MFEQIALKGMLEQYSIEADIAVNGREALQLVHAQVLSGSPLYKLVIMDYKMPIMKGNVAASMMSKFLSAEAPHREKPYIVCLTNFASSLLREKLDPSQDGINEVISKPIFKSGFCKLLGKAKLL